jgi:hypothetical protein
MYDVSIKPSIKCQSYTLNIVTYKYIYKLWSHPLMGRLHLNKIDYINQNVFIQVKPIT